MDTNAKFKGSARDARWPPGRRRCAVVALIATVVLVSAGSATALCPSKCICNDKLLEARCENSNLEVVPIQLNPELKHLKLNNNKISVIHSSFNFYTHLNELDLSYNKIKHLGARNFELQINLMKLNLSHNLVKQLHRDSFKGLRNLYVLDLSHNELEEVSERTAFKDLNQLQQLNLAGNNIYMVDSGVFDYLIDLRTLILSDNQLLRIPENAINTLNNLQEMNLNMNLIEEVSFPLNLKKLEVLKLRSNLISTLGNETLNSLSHLRSLDLSDNNFTQVPTYQLSKLNYLEMLNLSSNLFTYLRHNSFLNLYKLRELYIDNVSTLRKVDSKFLLDNFNLRLVSISNNFKLKYLPKFLFLNKPHLKHVNIAGNHFSTLDASDLPLDQLETLKLGRNPFQCNCSLLWLWILKEKQADNNCTCADASCFEVCMETLPKAEKLSSEYSDEYETSQETDSEEQTARFSSFAFNKDIFPIILDLEEIYCENTKDSVRIQFKNAPKSEFDCTMTWLFILAIAILIIIFIFFLTIVIYIIKIRCKRKAKNPVENFINATKSYEDTHHTYYRYGANLPNGDVFEVLKSEKNGFAPNGSTNMYIKSPVLKENISYPYSMNTFRAGEYESGNMATSLKRPYKKQFSNSNVRLQDVHNDQTGMNCNTNHMSDSNIYQEPFAGPVLTKNQRPPHIVYV